MIEVIKAILGILGIGMSLGIGFAYACKLVGFGKLTVNLNNYKPDQPAQWQEKHTRWTWRGRKTYYTYWRMYEGTVHQMDTLSKETINSLERGK